MDINHETGMRLWKERYGKGVEEAKDRKGRLMLKTAYGDECSKFGWNFHHKTPKNRGGTDAKENLEFVHLDTHDELHGRG